MPPTDQLLTVREVADATACHQTTVRKWVAAGAVVAVRVGPHDSIRIPAAELSRLIRLFAPSDDDPTT